MILYCYNKFIPVKRYFNIYREKFSANQIEQYNESQKIALCRKLYDKHHIIRGHPVNAQESL